MKIRPEPAKALSAGQECAMLRAAVAAQPRSAALRLRLARLLNQLDRFDETIALLGDSDEGEGADADALLTLAAALFARNAPGDTVRAGALAARAENLAPNAAMRSAALADRAKALLRLDAHRDARALLDAALDHDPHNAGAWRRLVTELLRTGEAETVLARADTLAQRGVGHARLFAARTLALAQLGRLDAARDVAAARYRHRVRLSPPPGWDTIEAFNAALVDELADHPGLRWERHGTASWRTWRIDALAIGAAPLARALLERIAGAVEAYDATLPDGADPGVHPWLAARPAAGELRAWCVITEGEGYEQWHTHPSGWLSGVYYARVPDAVTRGSDAGGCIAFGIADGLVGRDRAEAFGEERVRPEEGMLMLFPSHAYHRTYPHGAADRRICISFDIWPAAAEA